jgi:hypothetical protein
MNRLIFWSFLCFFSDLDNEFLVDIDFAAF